MTDAVANVTSFTQPSCTVPTSPVPTSSVPSCRVKVVIGAGGEGVIVKSVAPALIARIRADADMPHDRTRLRLNRYMFSASAPPLSSRVEPI